MSRYLRNLSQRLFKKRELSPSRAARFFIWVPVIAIGVIAGYLFIIPGFYQLFLGIEIPMPLGLSDRFNIFLTFGILIFAMIQGYSAFMQFLSGEIRNKIDDLRNELEKAYGSLYSILVNKRTNGKDNQIEVDPDEAKCLEHIMTTCPFMFPKDIQDI